MSLADKVIEANNKPKIERDEYGVLKKIDDPEYIAARIVFKNLHEKEKDPDAPLLHNRKHKTELWLGNRQLTKDKKTFYELAGIKRTIKDYEVQIIWDAIMAHTRSLDESKIMVSEHTYWDLETGELCHTDERMITI